MMFAWSLLLLSFGTLVPVKGTQTLNDVIDIFGDKLHIMRPGYGGDEPVEVKVSMFITDIVMDGFKPVLTVTMYVRQHWQDDRLGFQTNDSRSISLSGEDVDLIWTPDLFFTNLVDGFVQDVFQDNVMIRISPNGRVLLSQRVSVDVRCPLNMQRFPADTQVCSFNLESYSLTKNDIALMWMDGDPINVDTDLGIPQFNLSTINTSTRQNAFSTGVYQKLAASLTFRRNMGGHVVMFQIPSILLVISSWISFWLPIRFAHARMLIGILLLLGHMALSALPRALLLSNVAYMTLMDVWMAIDTALIFLAILETVAVLFFQRNEDQMSSDDGVGRPEGGTETIPMTDFVKPGQSSLGQKLGGKLSKLDFISRIAFPVLYLLVNIIYWSILSSAP
ncbi:gamma-aminobutyric acid receptor subunit rho-1-like [Branchiostoma floridae]|uniref:Gamma-aminobutyric acid receptor subunit rho-1-like n=1 Tax=Branchiostoma floridae TaxID=7739 RepID=A0A9J7HLD7_BRAFL|nr:gamma-aminobutyric acid receptor subunit rho-1-like [Branchiostoma floridae]